jgi:GT2 family glycosyltransferase
VPSTSTPPTYETGEREPVCSVIVPNWNGRHFLEPCLACLRAQTFTDFETIVVDNGSSDDSVEFVRRTFPDVRVRALAANGGFAAAINQGLEWARGRYVAFLNNDTEPEPAWLNELVVAMDRRRDAALADSKIVLFDDRSRLDSCGELYSSWGFPIPRGRDDHEDAYRDTSEVFGVCAGAMIARREVLEQIGVFDESFFMYYEDIDLSFRVRLAGFACLNVPSSRVAHHVGGTSGGLTPSMRFHALKNMALVYLKNMPSPLFWQLLPRFIVLQALLAASAVAKGQAKASVRAYAYLLRNRARIRGDRTRVQALSRISASELRVAMDPRFPAPLLRHLRR